MFTCDESYKIGEAFAHIPLSIAQERLQVEQADTEKSIEELKDRIESSETIMKELKVTLYAKFGKAINLEA